LLGDVRAVTSSLLFCTNKYLKGSEKFNIIFANMDDFQIFNFVCTYLDQLKNPDLWNREEADIVYYPTMPSFHEVWEREGANISHKDSLELIRKKLGHYTPPEMQYLLCHHNVHFKRSQPKDLIIELANYYHSIYTTTNDFLRLKKLEFKEKRIVNSKSEILKAIRALKSNTAWNILQAIDAINNLGSLVGEKEEKPTASKITQYIESNIDPNSRIHLSTAIHKLRDLRDAEIIIEKRDKSGKRGAYYTMSCEKCNIEIDFKKMFGKM